MDIAIITGADNPWGENAARILLELGFRVHAIGADFSRSTIVDRGFRAHPVESGRLGALKAVVDEILEQEGRVDVLLCFSRAGFPGEWAGNPIEDLVRRANDSLLRTIVATRLILPALLRYRGFLIHANLPSGDDGTVLGRFFQPSIKEFIDGLFTLYREKGLRTSHIEIPEGSGIRAENLLQSALGKALDTILRHRETTVIREVVIQPRQEQSEDNWPDLYPGAPESGTPSLPEREKREISREEILIPTEKPRTYVAIAEVESLDEEEDLYPDDFDDEDDEDEDRGYEDEDDGDDSEDQGEGEGDEPRARESGSSETQRPRRSRGSRRRRPRRKGGEGQAQSAPADDPRADAPESPPKAESPDPGESQPEGPKKRTPRKRSRRSGSRKPRNPGGTEGGDTSGNPPPSPPSE